MNLLQLLISHDNYELLSNINDIPFNIKCKFGQHYDNRKDMIYSIVFEAGMAFNYKLLEVVPNYDLQDLRSLCSDNKGPSQEDSEYVSELISDKIDSTINLDFYDLLTYLDKKGITLSETREDFIMDLTSIIMNEFYTYIDGELIEYHSEAVRYIVERLF